MMSAFHFKRCFMASTANLSALLFDVDGTLADTEKEGHRVAFNQAFSDAGLDWNWDEALYGKLLKVTGGKERIKFYLAEFNKQFRAPADLDNFVKGLHLAKTDRYMQLMAEGKIPLRPGVERLLDEALSVGLRLAIVTTTTPENVTALLKSTLGRDAIKWFEVIAAGDIVPAKKPAPDIYIWAMAQMKIHPSQAMAFEDSRNGLKSALDSRLKTLITINDYTAHEDFTGAAWVLDQLGEPLKPFKVLGGKVSSNVNATYVDVSLLRYLHQA